MWDTLKNIGVDFRNYLGLPKSKVQLRDVGSGAKYPDGGFLVIRPESSSGFLSLVTTSLGWIKIAEDRGLTPYIDFRRTLYSNSSVANPWDIIFKQPFGYCCSDIDRATHVYVASEQVPQGGGGMMYPAAAYWFFHDKWGWRGKWQKLFRRYICENEFFSCQIEKMKRNISFIANRTIGVLARGTDYTAMRPKGHPVMPTTEMIFARVDESLDGRNVDRIFLATEDSGILKKFVSRYGNRLLTSQKPMAYGGGFLSENGDFGVGRVVEYVASMNILSECETFISGMTSGAVYTCLLRNKNKGKEMIYDLGRYC